jgi:site-specific DNA-methyltransferase (adenine-specific)
VLSQIPSDSIDLILTDPPYMTTELDYDLEAIKSFDLKLWFDEIIRVAKYNAPILIFASGKFTYKMVNIAEKYFRYELIWDKINKTTNGLNANYMPLRNHEIILYFSKTFYRDCNNLNETKKPNTYNHGVIVDKNNYKIKGSFFTTYGKKEGIEYIKLNNAKYPKSILKYNKSNSNDDFIHPSEKPYGLIEFLVKTYSNENCIVLDTFSGSGVTAHACLLNNRKFISCELNKEFYKKSILRLQNDMFVDYNQ